MFSIELEVPIVVKTDGCRWTTHLRVHTAWLGRVEGTDDNGDECELEYDWLGGPTRHDLNRYEKLRNEKEKEGVPPISRQEYEALDYMHHQYKVRQ